VGSGQSNHFSGFSMEAGESSEHPYCTCSKGFQDIERSLGHFWQSHVMNNSSIVYTFQQHPTTISSIAYKNRSCRLYDIYIYTEMTQKVSM
jgi:hypothetical protein